MKEELYYMIARYIKIIQSLYIKKKYVRCELHNSKPNMLNTLQCGRPHRQTLGNERRPENKCPTNDGQHSCKRNWGSSSFWCLSFSSFCHRRMRKIDLKNILPRPSLWLDLTTTKRRRDQRKLFHDGDIISSLMALSGNKNLHVVMSMKMLTPKLSPSSSAEPSWRRRFHPSPSPSPERRRRR